MPCACARGSFLVSVLALFLSSRKADATYTFGYHRAETLGALASILVVWMMTAILLFEAMHRLVQPEIVDGPLMFGVSVLGVVMNVLLMQVLGHDHGHGDHGHGHSHGHSHSHGHAPPAYQPPKLPSSHGHDHHEEHAHGHAEHHAAEHGHGHDEEHAHGHAEHHAAEHGHGHHEEHDHDCAHHDAHAHDHEEQGDKHRHSSSGSQKERSEEHSHGVASGSHDCCDGHHEEEEGGHGAHRDDEEKSLAIRAAMAHVIGDIIASLGVCLSAGLIWAFHDRWLDSNGISYWYRADPICTFLFSFLVLSSTWSTMSEGMHVLMAGAPLNADTPSLLRRLQAIPSVVNVHDLHVWATSSDKINVWAHLTIKSGTDTTAVLYAAQKVAKSIGCHHTCFQLEDQLTYDLRVEGDECYMPGHVHP